MLFADIYGLEEVKKSLVSSVRQNHIAHAQLFFGAEGGAALPMALAFATYLNCENRKEEDSCGECSSCRKMHKFIHPDMHFVFPVSSTKKITGKEVVSASFLNEWRAFLAENPYRGENEWSLAFGGESKQLNISKEESRNIVKNLSLKSFEGKYKIMLIWMPEYMHVTAANGILKILEEPPAQTIFLLVTYNMEKLLVTILSRTQMFKIRPFSDKELQHILMEKYQVEEKKAAQLSQLTEGNLNAAVKLLDDVEDDSQKMFREWMRVCYSWDFRKMNEWMENFQAMSKAAQKGLFLYGLNMMRESLLLHMESNGLMRVQGEEQDFITNFSKVMLPDKIEKMSTLLNTALYHLERNASSKILFLDLSLNIAGVLRN